MRNDLSALDTALELLGRDLWPVVLHPPGATINTKDGPKTAKGKEPIGRAWGAVRLTEPELIKMFRDNPGAGVGVVLGPHGGAVDVEVDGPEGEASLSKLFDGVVVSTIGWSSRRGPHRLLAWDDRLAEIDPQRRAKLTLPELPGLELRFGQNRQAQSACPPSAGEDGLPRRWNGIDQIAPLPEAAFRFVAHALAEPPSVATNGSGPCRITVPCPPDTAGAWFGKAMENEAGKVATAKETTRHATLLAAARTLGGYLHLGYLVESDVTRELSHAGGRAGLPAGEVAGTIRDGLDYGKAAPLPYPEKLSGSGTDRIENGRASPEPDDDGSPIAVRPWPDAPSEAAYHGVAGRIVRTIEPQTEADSLGLLAQLIVMFGNLVGRGPYVRVESTRHHVNEFVVLVGQSATGRKGTAADRVGELLLPVDEAWTNTRIMSGLSSGEGLIAAVRDPVYRKEPIKEKGRVVDDQDVMVDEGVADKRLLVLESEFGRTLSVQGREGTTLTAVLRQAWDGKSLATMTKSAYRATDPHVSIIGHITADELLQLLSRVDSLNGYANRFLWVAVRRSKMLPFGGDRLDLSGLSSDLVDAANFARGVGWIEMTRSAQSLWASHYARLTTPPPGMLGAITSRAAPHTLRLAAIYALLDQTASIADDHLAAALAVWDAADRCAAYIFGDSLGNPDAEKILAALRTEPTGLTRAEIRSKVFSRNKPAAQIKSALALLMQGHLVREYRDEHTGGRDAYRYHADAKNALNAKSPSSPDRDRPSTLTYGVNGVYGVHAEGRTIEPDPAEREVFEL